MLGVDLHQRDELTWRWLSDLLVELRPQIAVTHPLRDVHPGHRETAELVVEALTGAVVSCGYPRHVYTCDTYNSLTLDGPVPAGTVVDITTTFDTSPTTVDASSCTRYGPDRRSLTSPRAPGSTDRQGRRHTPSTCATAPP